jgi:uncharacterized integral membrane protein
MRRFSNWAAWIAVIAVAGLAALNLNTLSTPAPIDLLVGRIEAPLGLVLLGLVAVLAAIFFIATLQNQVGSLMENRKLLKEIQRVQALADEAEASRMESLRQLIANEFRLMNDRMNKLAPQPLLPNAAHSA